jgi:murein DD-endopeptidase MepM/ murein hydrolase activator NlpD
MGVGQVVAAVGTGAAALTATIVALMEGRREDIQNGSFVQEQLAGANIPDIAGQYLCDTGRFFRGWTTRTVAGQQRLHAGLDIVSAFAVPVRTIRSGLVEHSGQLRGYGELVLIRHIDGSTGLYAHLNDRLVEQGQLVQGGTVIGRMGRSSTTGEKPQLQFQGRTGRDPRCDHFRNMIVHLHCSFHGFGMNPNLTRSTQSERRRGPIPSQARLPRAISSRIEENHGVDPVQYLGSIGAQQSLTRYEGEVVSIPRNQPSIEQTLLALAPSVAEVATELEATMKGLY